MGFDLYRTAQKPEINWASTDNGNGLECNYYRMPGNVLDLAIFEEYIIVSVDNIHKPNSIVTLDDSDVSYYPRPGPQMTVSMDT